MNPYSSIFHTMANSNAPSIPIAASMGLSNLQHEPLRLSSEAEKINHELDNLVMDNYKIFIENLTCSTHLRSEVSIVLLITQA